MMLSRNTVVLIDLLSVIRYSSLFQYLFQSIMVVENSNFLLYLYILQLIINNLRATGVGLNIFTSQNDGVPFDFLFRTK